MCPLHHGLIPEVCDKVTLFAFRVKQALQKSVHWCKHFCKLLQSSWQQRLEKLGHMYYYRMQMQQKSNPSWICCVHHVNKLLCNSRTYKNKIYVFYVSSRISFCILLSNKTHLMTVIEQTEPLLMYLKWRRDCRTSRINSSESSFGELKSPQICLLCLQNVWEPFKRQ